MIGSLTGTVDHVAPDSLLLTVNGVGYRVFALPTTLAAVKGGTEITLYTHLHVREDDLSLFGFQTMRELAFFHLLLQAPGVGPKTALGVLALANIDTLIRAITSGDADVLMKVSGIGRKTAERIVVELKTRLEREHPALAGTGMGAQGDVIEALVALGYSIAQARDAARKLPPDIESLEEGVRAALKALGEHAGRAH